MWVVQQITVISSRPRRNTDFARLECFYFTPYKNVSPTKLGYFKVFFFPHQISRSCIKVLLPPHQSVSLSGIIHGRKLKITQMVWSLVLRYID